MVQNVVKKIIKNYYLKKSISKIRYTAIICGIVFSNLYKSESRWTIQALPVYWTHFFFISPSQDNMLLVFLNDFIGLFLAFRFYMNETYVLVLALQCKLAI